MPRQLPNIRSSLLCNQPRTNLPWINSFPVGEAAVGLLRRNCRTWPWGPQLGLSIPGKKTRKSLHPRSRVSWLERKWKPRRDVKPGRTGFATIKKKALVKGTSLLKQQIGRYPQEIRALQFFEPEGKEADLACQVIAITDWAVKYNEFMTHPLPEIPTELLVPYSGPKQGRGQFPLAPTFEDTHSTDVHIRCQVMWTYLCAILQYFKDNMATREGALYGGKSLPAQCSCAVHNGTC